MSSSSHFVTAHVGSKFLAMTLFPTLCTGGRVRWRHNQIFWHQVAVRWPSRDSRRSSQSEFLKIRVDLNTSLQQAFAVLATTSDLDQQNAQDQVEGFQYLSGVWSWCRFEYMHRHHRVLLILGSEKLYYNPAQTRSPVRRDFLSASSPLVL